MDHLCFSLYGLSALFIKKQKFWIWKSWEAVTWQLFRSQQIFNRFYSYIFWKKVRQAIGKNLDYFATEISKWLMEFSWDKDNIILILVETILRDYYNTMKKPKELFFEILLMCPTLKPNFETFSFKLYDSNILSGAP